VGRKPGARWNGAPFKDWVLPDRLEWIRRKLAGAADGDRQLVSILAAALIDGLRLSKRRAWKRCARVSTRLTRSGPTPRASDPRHDHRPDVLPPRHAPTAD
jgi:hypothetical protein